MFLEVGIGRLVWDCLLLTLPRGTLQSGKVTELLCGEWVRGNHSICLPCMFFIHIQQLHVLAQACWCSWMYQIFLFFMSLVSSSSKSFGDCFHGSGFMLILSEFIILNFLRWMQLLLFEGCPFMSNSLFYSAI